MSDAFTLKISAVQTPAGQASFDPFNGALQDDFSVDEFSNGTVVEVPVGTGYTASTAHMATGSYAAIKNMDSAIDVTVAWEDSDSHTNTQRIPPGRSFYIPDFKTASLIVLVADSGTPLCKISFGGT
uniref:Uncharacterized protein n=1 Tax=viral metagenome TaxID=1070528 RepID=A0A6H1ZVD3_9ZZZZ